MKRKDYKCVNCKSVFEMIVSDTDEFPDTITCERCGEIAKKMFAAISGHVLQGKTGNYKNGYKTNPGYVKKT